MNDFLIHCDAYLMLSHVDAHIQAGVWLKFQWVHNGSIPWKITTTCNATVGPLLMAATSCLVFFFCQLDATFAFSLTSVNGYCRVSISLRVWDPVHGTSIWSPQHLEPCLRVQSNSWSGSFCCDYRLSLHPFFLMWCYDFMITRHFSKTNQVLEKLGLSAIDWQL
jgi:hypothetical protein